MAERTFTQDIVCRTDAMEEATVLLNNFTIRLLTVLSTQLKLGCAILFFILVQFQYFLFSLLLFALLNPGNVPLDAQRVLRVLRPFSPSPRNCIHFWWVKAQSDGSQCVRYKLHKPHKFRLDQHTPAHHRRLPTTWHHFCASFFGTRVWLARQWESLSLCTF